MTAREYGGECEEEGDPGVRYGIREYGREIPLYLKYRRRKGVREEENSWGDER